MLFLELVCTWSVVLISLLSFLPPISPTTIKNFCTVKSVSSAHKHTWLFLVCHFFASPVGVRSEEHESRALDSDGPEKPSVIFNYGLITPAWTCSSQAPFSPTQVSHCLSPGILATQRIMWCGLSLDWFLWAYINNLPDAAIDFHSAFNFCKINQ